MPHVVTLSKHHYLVKKAFSVSLVVLGAKPGIASMRLQMHHLSQKRCSMPAGVCTLVPAQPPYVFLTMNFFFT